MLAKLLSPTDKKHLLGLLELLALADKPLLWDGKRREEITSETNLDKVSIQKGEQESMLIADMESEVKPSLGSLGGVSLGPLGGVLGMGMGMGLGVSAGTASGSVETSLIAKLKTFPLQVIEDPETRTQAAAMIMKKLLEEKKFELPAIPKLMLFELMLMALCNGSISSIELALLKDYQHHHKLEDFIFDDILERAETMTQEVSKTISIIFE